jgi:hypothetical protein
MRNFLFALVLVTGAARAETVIGKVYVSYKECVRSAAGEYSLRAPTVKEASVSLIEEDKQNGIITKQRVVKEFNTEDDMGTVTLKVRPLSTNRLRINAVYSPVADAKKATHRSVAGLVATIGAYSAVESASIGCEVPEDEGKTYLGLSFE